MAFEINQLPSIGYLIFILLLCYALYMLIDYLNKRAVTSLRKEEIKTMFEELKIIKQAKEQGIDLEKELERRGLSLMSFSIENRLKEEKG